MDLLRGLAILGVVIGHISAESLYEELTVVGLLFNQIIRFAVPVFIFLSGMGLRLSRKPYSSYLRFIWYRLRKILPFYCLWTILYLITDDSTNQPLALSRISKALISGDASYHLYFIPLIVQFYLVFPFLHKCLRQTSGLLLSLAITLAIQFSNLYLSVPTPWAYFIDQRNFLSWLFYFALGIWSASRLTLLERSFKQKRSTILLLLLFCSLGLIIEASIYLKLGKGLELSLTQMRPSVIIYSLVFGRWVWSSGQGWPGVIKSFLTFLSTISYEIFLVHVFLLTQFTWIFLDTGQSRVTLVYGISALLIVLSTSILLVLAQRSLFKRLV